jgi:hypothetical protein
MSYNNVFGGGTVQAADVSFRAVVLSADVQLVWPAFSKSNTDYAARTMNFTQSTGLILFNVKLPPANAVSTGYDLLFSNKGSYSFNVRDYAGNAVATLAPGAVKYLKVTDNTSEAGVWDVVGFGATMNAVDAGTLAGPGVSASGAVLQASAPVTAFSANMTIAQGDRAKVYVWTGGTGTQTLPLTTALGVGGDFFYELRNQGTGLLTLAASGSDTIDGAGSIALQPTESATIHSSGTGFWYTVGRGRSTQFNFSLLVKAITGGTVTLSSTEAANVVQRYTGALISNANIVLPSVVQVYYVSNQTSGAFSVSFKTAGVGSVVTVPSNQNAILFCDGLNVINTSTTVAGLSALTLAQGSAGAPSLGYSGDTSTGVYQPATGAVGVTTAGVQRVQVDNNGLTLTATPNLLMTDPTATLSLVANPTLADATARIELYGATHATLPRQAIYRGVTHKWTSSSASTPYAQLGAGGLAVTGPVTGATFNGLLASANVSQFTNDAGYITATGPAAAGSLTGTTLAANVVASSLTSVGALTGLTVNGTSVIAPSSGTALLVVARSSLGAGQNSINFQTSGGATWQLYQQSAGTALGFYNNALGRDVLSMSQTTGDVTVGSALSAGNYLIGATAGTVGYLGAAGAGIELYGAASGTPNIINFRTSNALRVAIDAAGTLFAAGNVSVNGLVFGRSGGGTGLGRITTTPTSGSPAGTSQGDLVLVY